MSIVTLTPSALSGIGVPYALEADLDATTAGQYGPQAGHPTPSEDALGRGVGLALGASGAQTATTTLTLTTQRAGNVGDAGYRWKRTVSGVVDLYERGSDLPNILVSAAFPGWAAAANQRNAHALTLNDDTQVIVCEQVNGIYRDIKCYVWSATTGAFAAAVTVRSGLDASHNLSPALLALPSANGSGTDPILLCGYWNPDDTNNLAQIDVSYSRDQGATWAVWQRNVLPAAITINSGAPYQVLGRFRWAMVGVQIVLFAHLTASSGTRENVVQYASNTCGVSFVSVGTIANGGYPDVVSVEQMAWMGYVQTGDGASLIPVSNAFELANTSEEIDSAIGSLMIFSTTFSYGSFAMALEANRIYCLAVSVSADRRFGHSSMFTIEDRSATDLVITPHGNTWWDDNNSVATEFPSGICATMYRGQVRVYCTMTSGTGTFDDRLTRLDVGGPSTITMQLYSATTQYIPVAWDWTTLPTALASAYGATFAGAGTRSISTNTGWETLTTVANTAYYERAPTATAAQQIIELIRVQVDSGGGVSSRVVACGLRAAGVGYGFEFELRCSTTQIRFRDVNGASDETTVTVATTAGVDVLLAIAGDGTASAWYRTVGSDEDRNYLPIEVAFALTDDAGAGGTANVVRWGNPAAGTATTRWVEFGGNAGSNLGASDLAGGLTFPDDLRAVPFSSRSYAGAGVYLRASGGPTFVGDIWTIRPDADRPARYLAPVGDDDSASNVRGGQRTSSTEEASSWWGTATSGDVVLRFNVVQNRYLSPLTFFHTEGCNGRDPEVIAYSVDGGAYTVLGTLTNSTSGLRWLRASANSQTVRVDTSGTSSTEPYIRSGTLKGGWFHFTTNDKVRPILDNTEGRWSNDGDAPPLILTLGGIDGTEATSGSTGVIIYPRATFVYAATAATEYGKFGLRWGSAPDLYEAQLRCKVFAVGPIEPLLYAKAWGTNYSVEDAAELTETRAGLRRGRRIKSAQRRVLSLPLTTMWDRRPALDPSNTHQHVYKAYSDASYPIAGQRGDEFGKLLGAWQRSGGSQHPVVWIPRIATSATQSLVGDAAGFYCRVRTAGAFTDAYGRDTGTVYAPQWSGGTWVLEEEI